jgi:hypothetical protein
VLKSLLPLGLELLVIVVNELVEEAFFGFSPSVLDESSGVVKSHELGPTPIPRTWTHPECGKYTSNVLNAHFFK